MWSQFKNSHWTSLLFFLPLLIMLIVHHVLDISDNILGQPESEQMDGMLFNYVMFYAWGIGNLAFIAHTATIKPIQIAIIIPKMFVLPAVYLLMLI